MNMKISFATVVSGAIALHASLAYATGSCGVAGEFTDKVISALPPREHYTDDSAVVR